MISWWIIFTIELIKTGSQTMHCISYIKFTGYLLFFCVLNISCSDSKQEEIEVQLSDPSFTFHQDVNKLYFSINAPSFYKNQKLDSVVVNWYSVSNQNNPDIIFLNDDGIRGDIIMDDEIYGRKIINDELNLINPLISDTGLVFMEYHAMFGDEKMSLKDSIVIGNIIPVIESVTVPDTITRPSDATVSLHLIKASANDADGKETIKWVGFTSFHVEGDSLMNNGNFIYLYDDGSDTIRYLPNITSGDSIRGDGIFSFRIPVYGTGFTQPGFQTKAGTFNWRFICQDIENEYSKVVEHEIVIQ